MEQLTFDCGNVVLRYKPFDKFEKVREKLLPEFQDTMATLLQKFSGFDQDQLNAVPEDDGWTAGQVGSHLLKSYSVAKTLNGNTSITTRPPDQKVNEIRETFRDFDIKMDSPIGVLPSDGPFDHESLLPLLEKRISQIAEVIRTKDLTLTCEDFAIPEYGKFTRLEWINFVIYHTQRHFRQLDRLAESFTG